MYTHQKIYHSQDHEETTVNEELKKQSKESRVIAESVIFTARMSHLMPNAQRQFIDDHERQQTLHQ